MTGWLLLFAALACGTVIACAGIAAFAVACIYDRFIASRKDPK